MQKDPHAVALGRRGGRAGGRRGGLARAAALSAERRREIARAAAAARWQTETRAEGLLELPEGVARLLKSYDLTQLRWEHLPDRWAIVAEILVRGSQPARAWLNARLSRRELQVLARRFRGAGLNEPARERVRAELGLDERAIPKRDFLGFTWEQAKR